MSKQSRVLSRAIGKGKAAKIEATMAAKGYITVDKVIELTGVHEVTVYRWIADDEVHSLKMNGRRWVSKKSLVEKVGPEVAKILGIDKPETPKA